MTEGTQTRRPSSVWITPWKQGGAKVEGRTRESWKSWWDQEWEGWQWAQGILETVFQLIFNSYCLVKGPVWCLNLLTGVIDIQELYLFVGYSIEFGDNYTSVVLEWSWGEWSQKTREEGKFAQFSECQRRSWIYANESTAGNKRSTGSQACPQRLGEEGLARCHPAQLWLVSCQLCVNMQQINGTHSNSNTPRLHLY